MRCVLYLRVSTKEQAEKGEGTEGFSIRPNAKRAPGICATPAGRWSTSTSTRASQHGPPTARG